MQIIYGTDIEINRDKTGTPGIVKPLRFKYDLPTYTEIIFNRRT